MMKFLPLSCGYMMEVEAFLKNLYFVPRHGIVPVEWWFLFVNRIGKEV